MNKAEIKNEMIETIYNVLHKCKVQDIYLLYGAVILSCANFIRTSIVHKNGVIYVELTAWGESNALLIEILRVDEFDVEGAPGWDVSDHTKSKLLGMFCYLKSCENEVFYFEEL